MKQVFVLLAFICISGQMNAQFSLTGKVTGNSNEPLTGAYVILQDTYYKTITDKDGNYKLTGVKKGNYVLQVSYMGYESENIAISLNDNLNRDIQLKESTIMSNEVVISAVRATRNTPTTFTTLDKNEIEQKNVGQDLPFILNLEPSVVTTSDAGTGVGYTGLRIRGSDITRINVTINGVPLNDPESQVVYWVDVPDFSSSVNSLQMQRGVGSSTNGAGAFGASLNLETNTIQKQPFAEFNASYGSFNTWKTTFRTGTGLINNHWYFEGRASEIKSDGYIDRASSNLQSFFIQGGYTSNKTLIKFVTFGGYEKTYQSWYGTDSASLKSDRTFNWAGVYYDANNNIHFYSNQTDNYWQNHYQLHISQQLTPTLDFNISGFYIYGRGYYEEYEQNQSFADYGLKDLYFGYDSTLVGGNYQYFYHDTIRTTDLIRRRWLDNRFYGITWALNKKTDKINIIFGGAFNKYDNAKHYGQIIWAEYPGRSNNSDPFYYNVAFKTEFNAFTKVVYTPAEKLSLYADMQYRYITYKCHGDEIYFQPIDINKTYGFFNPKIGASYDMSAGQLYISYAVAHREPVRDDYVDAAPGEVPKPEILGDFELGIRKKNNNFQYAVNYFLMNYRNQLVLTGAINDIGSYIRKNVGKSYRTGIELSAGYKMGNLFSLSGNVAISRNKTDYTLVNSENQITTLNNRDISFSPWLITGLDASVFPVRNLEFEWLLKYVSRQYLDNSQSDRLSLPHFMINNLRINYLLQSKYFKNFELSFLVNNIFNVAYESNGYTDGVTPYYYPQAERNLMAALSVKF